MVTDCLLSTNNLTWTQNNLLFFQLWFYLFSVMQQHTCAPIVTNNVSQWSLSLSCLDWWLYFSPLLLSVDRNLFTARNIFFVTFDSLTLYLNIALLKLRYSAQKYLDKIDSPQFIHCHFWDILSRTKCVFSFSKNQMKNILYTAVYSMSNLIQTFGTENFIMTCNNVVK